jgi:D-alanyl-D-alanine carboxypeptidase (penicillin-binding protein 5/6)
MQNDLLREIVSEKSWSGNGAGSNPPEGSLTQNYSWESHNELIMGGTYEYDGANGIKTGFTDEAGNCLCASAQRGGVDLISVVFNSHDPNQWLDTKHLLDYGFDNYAFRSIQKSGQVLEAANVVNTRLGDPNTLNVLATADVQNFMSEDEAGRVVRTLTFDDSVKAQAPSGGASTALAAPIAKGADIGTVTYTLDGQTIYEGPVKAAADMLVRTRATDAHYYIQKVKTAVLTTALPFWVGAAVLLAAVVLVIVVIARRRRRRSSFSLMRRHYRF